MSVARVTEITSQSPDGFEAAIRDGLRRASETIRHIEGAWIKEQEVILQENEIKAYKVIMKVTFLLEGPEHSGRAQA